MKQTISVTYPVTPEVLLRALTDRAFHEAKIQALGALRSQVLSDGRDGDEYVIRIRRSMRNTAQVPALLKKLIPENSTLEHEDRFDAKAGKGHLVLCFEGLPVQLSCELTAIARGDGTELRHEWDIRCSLPIVGGAVERFVAADLPQRMEAEASAGRPLLARYA